ALPRAHVRPRPRHRNLDVVELTIRDEWLRIEAEYVIACVIRENIRRSRQLWRIDECAAAGFSREHLQARWGLKRTRRSDTIDRNIGPFRRLHYIVAGVGGWVRRTRNTAPGARKDDESSRLMRCSERFHHVVQDD